MDGALHEIEKTEMTKQERTQITPQGWIVYLGHGMTFKKSFQ